MKKILLSLAVVACAAAANAQDGAPLYVTGDADFGGWNPGEPLEMTYEGGKYTLSVADGTQFKVSTTKGTWDEFNAGCLCTESTPENGVATPLVPGDANIILWQGDWKIEVAGDLSTITCTSNTPKPTGPAEIYLRGSWDESWSAVPERMFTFKGDDVYELNGVEVGDNKFKIGDANWGVINYGFGEIFLDEEYVLDLNGVDMYFGEEVSTVDFKFNLATATLICTAAGEGGIEGVAADNNAPKVYYNLQGVQVANPANGLYIVKQGNKASKVLVK